MKPIFELLESRGVVTELDALALADRSHAELQALYSDVYALIHGNQFKPVPIEAQNDPFRFLASAALRSDAVCWELPCRVRKLDYLSRFSALYANHVSLPLLLEAPESVSDHPGRLGMLLSRSLISILYTRPLIEADLLKPVVMRSQHCCEQALADVHAMQNAVWGFAEYMAKQTVKDFSAFYQLPEKSPSGRATVYLSGPREFLEHDIVLLFDENPSFRVKTWRFDSEGKTELKGKRKLLMVQRVFEPIAQNTSFYLTYGRQQSTRLLSDLAGEVFMLEDLESQEQSTANTQVFSHLRHTLPLLGEMDVNTLLKIRREDRDSFAAYRYEIKRLCEEAETQALSLPQAREFFAGHLEPKLNALRRELAAERAKAKNYLAGGLSALAISLTIGAFGFPPLVAAAALLPISGVAIGMLNKGIQGMCDVCHDAKKNDLYFLLDVIGES